MTIKFDASMIADLNVVVLSSSYEEEKRIELVKFLKKQGVRAWSEEDLTPGGNWRLETLRKINEAHFVIILLSQEGARQTGFFQVTIKEAKGKAMEFLDGHIFIIPVVFDEVTDVNALGLPAPLKVLESEDWREIEKTFNFAMQQRSQ